MVVILLAVWCVVLCAWLWIKPKKLEPPTFPGSLPIIGHTHTMVPYDPVRIWETEILLYQNSLDSGGIVKFLLGPVTVYTLSDPDDCYYVLNTCMDKPYVYGFGKRVYNRGLVTAETRTWKPHRSLLNPAFNQQIINSFVQIFCCQAKRMVSNLESEVGTSFDIQPYLTRNVMSSAFGTLLGVDDIGSTEIIDKYARVSHELFTIYYNRISKVWLHLPLIFNMSSYKKQEDVLSSDLKDITDGIIKNRKMELKNEALDNNNNKTGRFKSLIDIMLELSEEKDAFTDDEIREHLDTLIVAAFDSSLCAMTYITILIGSHPEVQERIFEEIQEVLQGESRDLTRHDLAKLVYLEAVIKEGLRLYPPAPKIARISNSTLKLREYIFPANSLFVISVYGIGRHPMWGPDANEFKPERWLDPNTLPANRHAFSVFRKKKLYWKSIRYDIFKNNDSAFGTKVQNNR